MSIIADFIIGNYLLGAEMHRITGKSGFMKNATELIQKTREAALKSAETGVYALTPEIIQFAANLGFPTMAGAETTKVNGISHVAIGAVDKALYDPATGVYLGGPGGTTATALARNEFHGYTHSYQWVNIGLGGMEYYFIAP